MAALLLKSLHERKTAAPFDAPTAIPVFATVPENWDFLVL